MSLLKLSYRVSKHPIWCFQGASKMYTEEQGVNSKTFLKKKSKAE